MCLAQRAARRRGFGSFGMDFGLANRRANGRRPGGRLSFASEPGG